MLLLLDDRNHISINDWVIQTHILLADLSTVQLPLATFHR